MSAFKNQKRKSSIKADLGSPGAKAIKIDTYLSTSPIKTPKQENKKTPKSFNQHKATPFVKSNKQTPNQVGGNLQMFSGTGKLDFRTPTNAASPLKKGFKTPNSATDPGKKHFKTPKIQSGATNVFKASNSTIGSGKRESEGVNSESIEPKLNRSKRRRTLNKDKRRVARQKIRELKEKAIHGDEVAKKEIQQKIAEYEGVGTTLSKNKRRKLAVLKRVLHNKDTSTKNAMQPDKKKAINIQQKDVNKNLPKKQQNVKQAQTKVPPKLDSDDDNEEDEDDDDEQESVVKDGSEDDDDEEDGDEDDDDDDDDENGFDKLVIDEKLGSAEEASDDDEDEEDEEQSDDDEDESDEDEEQSDEDEEQSDEQNAVTINKQTVQQQHKQKNKPQSDEQNAVTINKKTVQQQNQQKNKPGKQEVPPKGPANVPNKSRYVVFVGNIAYASTKDDLQEHFKKAGDVTDIRIPTSNDGKPRGFAYVELANEASYQKALSLHNTFLSGRKINVSYTQGGKKKSPNQKNDIKAKNFKLQAMRKQGQLQGSVKHNQKRSVRRGNNQKRGT